MQICCKNVMIKSDIESLESIHKFALNSASKPGTKNYDHNLQLFNLIPLSTHRATSRITLLFRLMKNFSFFQIVSL